MLAKETWKALHQCQIDTYLGFPNIVTHDTGTNFDFTKFQAETKVFDIICHQILVKAHQSIEKVEKYYAPICRAYDIIQAETKSIISKNAILQMAFKAVNNTAGSDSLIPTLFIFSAYPRIVTNLPPSLSQQ